MKRMKDKIQNKLFREYYDQYLDGLIKHQLRGTGTGLFTRIFDGVSQNVKKL